jgi:hypothetical protein
METDAEFVADMEWLHSHDREAALPPEKLARLFALARRGADAADRIERLRALLTPKLLDENAPKDRMLIGLERPPYEDKTYYSMVQWREDTGQWMMEAGVDWSVSPGRRVWAYCGVSHYIDPLELPGLPYWEGKDEEDGDDE